jgi:hypothetical protein
MRTWRGWWAATVAGSVAVLGVGFAVGAAATARWGVLGPAVSTPLAAGLGYGFVLWARGHRPGEG